MFTALFNNVCISIGLVNGAGYISVCIVSNDDDMFNLRLVYNQAINYSDLLSTRCKYNFMQLFSKSYITT